MDNDYVETSIKSFKARLKQRKDDVIAAVRDDSYWVAQTALNDCVAYEAVIAELEFQLEVAEVNNG